jgi:hypothetical protein
LQTDVAAIAMNAVAVGLIGLVGILGDGVLLFALAVLAWPGTWNVP